MSDQILVADSQSVNPGRIIHLTQGYTAIVDEDDHESLSQYNWCVTNSGRKKIYACRSNKKGQTPRLIQMHRQILNAQPGVEVDHANGNGLDNRKTNLRLCNRSQNVANQKKCRGESSKYKGVYIHRGLWMSLITHRGGPMKQIFLGRYEREEDAALAYDRKARELFGEFAQTNFHDDDGHPIFRVSKPKPIYRGESSPVAKVSDNDAIEIRRRALAGDKQAEIARDFGISTQLVSAYKTGVSRPHLWVKSTETYGKAAGVDSKASRDGDSITDQTVIATPQHG